MSRDLLFAGWIYPWKWAEQTCELSFPRMRSANICLRLGLHSRCSRMWDKGFNPVPASQNLQGAGDTDN